MTIAVSGPDLFVTNNNNGTIGEYNATSGAVVKSSLVSGLDGPIGIAVPSSSLGLSANSVTLRAMRNSGTTDARDVERDKRHSRAGFSSSLGGGATISPPAASWPPAARKASIWAGAATQLPARSRAR